MMQVLSLFDGISCGQVALNKCGIVADAYFASEIEKSAIDITMNNFPKTIQIGNINNIINMVDNGLFKNIDLLIGGSPCQGFSRAGNNLGFLDERSNLIFQYIYIKSVIKPNYWLLENVKMKKNDIDFISMLLNTEPTEINSKLFSAQNRTRLYWTNITIGKIYDKKIKLCDILEKDQQVLKSFKVNKTPYRMRMWNDGNGKGSNGTCKNITFADKSQCLTTNQDRRNNAGLIEFEDFCRYLTPIECERLQNLPDNYTNSATKNKRYKHLGNGWTVDVIAHILKGML